LCIFKEKQSINLVFLSKKQKLLSQKFFLFLIILSTMGIEHHKKSEWDVVKSTQHPNTITSLKQDFESLGIMSGQILIMHSSLSAIGWTVGGPVTVIKALMETLTSKGTLVMPTFSGDNTDPSNWENPPVPESWWNIIRNEMPPYHPEITPTRGMGVIVDIFRKCPNVIRSHHPTSSFAAWGKYAEFITENHELIADLGEDSPLARIYELNGKILLVGVSHENNSSLHLAEYRSDYQGKHYKLNSSALQIDSERKWIEWKELNLMTDDFEQLGADFESKTNYNPGKVGIADVRLLSQREMVDFAVKWFKENRKTV